MAEFIGIASGIAGMLSLGIQIAQTLHDYYLDYRDQCSEIHKVEAMVSDLIHMLKEVQECLVHVQNQRDENLLKRFGASVQACEEDIRKLGKLSAKCQKIETSGSSFRNMLMMQSYRIYYPFQKGTLSRLEERIGRIQESLSLALQVVQLRTSLRLRDRFDDTQLLHVYQWLDAPDATKNHHAACRNRLPGTGLWFVNGTIFSEFLAGNQRKHLWLRGFAGCGKSVLCSTIIERIQEYRARSILPKIGLSFFYFTFTDFSKHEDSHLLRALIHQLSLQVNYDDNLDLIRLYENFKHRTAPVSCLLDVLHSFIRKFDRIFIVLDALDESPEEGYVRRKVLQTLDTIQQWKIESLHLVVSSRGSYDIEQALSRSDHVYKSRDASPKWEKISLRNTGIDRDIASLVRSEVRYSERLSRWPDLQLEIEETLISKADGIFRWVECQIDSFKKGPQTRALLRARLNRLPASLADTYDRILAGIDDDYRLYAQRIFTMLCFARRPLTVEELLDATCIRLDNKPGLNLDDRFTDGDDIVAICPDFIEYSDITDLSPGRVNRLLPGQPSTQRLQLAHFSVLEYFKSNHLQKHPKLACYFVEEAQSNALIAEICLVYMLKTYFAAVDFTTDPEVHVKFPFLDYAMFQWYYHFKASKSSNTQIEKYIDDLYFRHGCLCEGFAFSNWSSFLRRYAIMHLPPSSEQLIGHKYKHRANHEYHLVCHINNFSPLIHAAATGISSVMANILKHQLNQKSIECCRTNEEKFFRKRKPCQELATNPAEDEMAELFYPGNNHSHARENSKVSREEMRVLGEALLVAAEYKEEKMVAILIESGADVNFEGLGCTALQLAAENGSSNIIQLLVNHGADLDAMMKV